MIKVLHVVVNKIDIIGIRHKVYYLPFLVQDVWNRTFGIIVSLFVSIISKKRLDYSDILDKNVQHFEIVDNFVYQNLEIKSADKVQQLRDHMPTANQIQYLISETDMLDCLLKNQSNEAIIRLHQNLTRSVTKLSRTMLIDVKTCVLFL